VTIRCVSLLASAFASAAGVDVILSEAKDLWAPGLRNVILCQLCNTDPSRILVGCSQDDTPRLLIAGNCVRESSP
jgi:hypothetical protein